MRKEILNRFDDIDARQMDIMKTMHDVSRVMCSIAGTLVCLSDRLDAMETKVFGKKPRTTK